MQKMYYVFRNSNMQCQCLTMVGFAKSIPVIEKVVPRLRLKRFLCAVSSPASVEKDVSIIEFFHFNLRNKRVEIQEN